MAWWANVADMANTLERMEAGGNWTTQNTSSLFGLGQKYPEFKKSKNWFAMGFDGLKQNLTDNIYPDGPCREATTGYHSFSLGMFYDVITRAKAMGLDVREEHLKRLESAFNYSMYTTQPDWTLPVWGDTNRPIDQTGQILQGAKYFNRPDMLWVGTKGKEGKEPAQKSIAFTESGYYIMRSGWEPDARFLVTRNGFSQSHYHHDQLGVIVQAYGSDLLPDMGVYTYGTPECNELVRTVSHSTVSVDGKDISPGNGESAWATLPGFDFFDGTSPGFNSLPGIRHRRRILFVKPDYWVIADDVTGQGEHKSEQFWHFAPRQGAPEGKPDQAKDWLRIMPDNLDVDLTTGTVRTKNATGGNLAVIPLGLIEAGKEAMKNAGPTPKAELGPQPLTFRYGQALYAINWEKIGKSAVASYEWNGPLPHRFLTVLYPYPAGKPTQARAAYLSSDDPGVQAARAYKGESIDYIAFSDASRKTDLPSAKLSLSAQAALVRTNAKSGKATAFAWFEGSSLSFGGTVLASSQSPVRALSVRLDGDTIRIDTDAPAPGLTVSTLGAKRAVVNGKQVAVAKGAKTISLRQQPQD